MVTMPAITIAAVGLTDPPPWPDLAARPVLHHDTSGTWRAAVLNAGMTSGEPSVTIAVDTPDGVIYLETSLLALLACARGLESMATHRFGWTMPP
jgi:hypothetical protein